MTRCGLNIDGHNAMRFSEKKLKKDDKESENGIIWRVHGKKSQNGSPGMKEKRDEWAEVWGWEKQGINGLPDKGKKMEASGKGRWEK